MRKRIQINYVHAALLVPLSAVRCPPAAARFVLYVINACSAYVEPLVGWVRGEATSALCFRIAVAYFAAHAVPSAGYGLLFFLTVTASVPVCIGVCAPVCAPAYGRTLL